MKLNVGASKDEGFDVLDQQQLYTVAGLLAYAASLPSLPGLPGQRASSKNKEQTTNDNLPLGSLFDRPISAGEEYARSIDIAVYYNTFRVY